MSFTDPFVLWFTLLVIVVAALLGVNNFLQRRQHQKSGLRNYDLFWKSLAVILLILAVSGPFLERIEETSKATLLLDISDSMNVEVADTLLRQIDSIRSDRFNIDILPFARDTASISSESFQRFQQIKTSWSGLDTGATNLERALEQGARHGSGNILLLSDGFETEGDSNRFIRELNSRDISVFPFAPLTDVVSSGFVISNLRVPLLSPSASQVDIRTSIRNDSSEVERGVLKVTHDQEVVYEEEVEVGPGEELLLITPGDASKEGITEVTSSLTPLNQSLPPSSRTAYVSGEKRERILLLSGSQEDARYLEQVLKDQAFELTSLVARERLSTLPELSDHSAVILNNIHLNQLPSGSDRQLQRYTHSGGGLLMLGGNRGFGLGGYRNTPVEEAMPVNMLPPQREQKRLSVAVQLVIDKSGSMRHHRRMELTNHASKEVVRNMKDDDYLGVVAFDSTPFVVVQIDKVSRIRQTALERIDRIMPARGTNLFPGMDEARRALMRVDAGRKHMIILTDGILPDDGPHYPEFARQIRAHGITISTVMLGGEASVETLKRMAEFGGGTFYQSMDGTALPRIFLADIHAQSGEQTLQEQQEYTVRTGTGELKSTQVRGFPPLRGYVQTRAKTGTNLELVAYASNEAEPLLVSWDYGSGRAAAFTSDANGRWSNYWVNWGNFHRFWSDVVQSVRPPGIDTGQKIRFDLTHSVERDELLLDVTVYADDIRDQLEGVLLTGGREEHVSFSRVASGRYQARVSNLSPGKVEAQLRLGEIPLTPVAFDLPEELFGERERGFNLPFLSTLASRTGGVVNPSATELMDRVYSQREKTDLRPLFIILAILSLLMSIFSREVFRGWLPARLRRTGYLAGREPLRTASASP